MKVSMKASKIILFSYCLFSALIAISTAIGTITVNQTIRDDGNSTIVSAGEVFELGFFSPGSSKNRYVGIWYKKISNRTVVWVANREVSLFDTTGVLKMDADGNLVISDGKDSIIWSTNSSRSAINPVAQLLDSGNLVIRYENDSDTENYLWQSFDHPGDHRLPGMKIGWDLVKGLERYITSWKSADDPSPGNYTFRLSIDGFPQLILRKGSVVQFRYGPWDGIKFNGVGSIADTSFITSFILDQKEIYYRFETSSRFILTRAFFNQNGNIQILTWMDQTQTWISDLTIQRDVCDQYALCGANGNCNITQSQLGYDTCGCLKGFEPKFPERWRLGDWSNGCVQKIQFDCGNGDRFMKYSGLKLPDTRRSWFNRSMNLEECQRVCLKNCSCTAYSNIYIRGGGVGCLLWFDDLIDIRDYDDDGIDLYVRMPASELDANWSSGSKGKKRIKVIAVSVILTVLLVLLVLLGLFISKKRKLKRKLRKGALNSEIYVRNKNEAGDLELPLFGFISIANATKNFSLSNKLGEGGFGSVYKGILDDEQEIAVKRLSKTSKQGLDEFKNEVSCIAKLQHRNLVRLLGCCIEEGEMMLIYEYMPNKSLDSFLFDKELSKSLDWPKRYNIIHGIARGLLYLHQDSRLRIIHRDLKASNILLDHEMNPRISDFGLARSFGGSEIEVNTTRVVGTYGYMSPEYALDGIFSVKSDVYSFGVLVLEIVSGIKMKGFYHPDPGLNLLGHGWRLYNEGKFLELLDETILESYNQSEVLRTIQIGLLCVQSHPEDRPSMPFVVLMLSSDAELPQPNQPGFFIRRKLHESGSSSRNPELSSSNQVTVTCLSPR